MYLFMLHLMNYVGNIDTKQLP